MGRLHAREQEAVDLLYYLWKAYKAAPDEEFVTYIKDLKSQCDDGRATFTTEELMVRAENKYEARLVDEENAWGKPTEDQEKIVAMTAEIIPSRRNAKATLPPSPPSQKRRTKHNLPRNLNRKRRRSRRRKRATSGHGRTSPLKNLIVRRTTNL